MADYDAAGKLTLKIVYYGPAQGGKTTNIMRLHDQARSEMIGEIMTLETQHDRTLYFDLLPLGFRAPSGLLVKFRLFTVPGQVAHDATRKAVLSRADGVMFVADSRRSHSANNGESFQNLADNAARVGLDFESLPLVVQFNKRDLPDILSEEEIAERWRSAPWPLTYASALSGEGVQESFVVLLELVYRRVDREFHLSAEHGLTQAGFVDGATGRMRA